MDKSEICLKLPFHKHIFRHLDQLWCQCQNPQKLYHIDLWTKDQVQHIGVYQRPMSLPEKNKEGN